MHITRIWATEPIGRINANPNEPDRTATTLRAFILGTLRHAEAYARETAGERAEPASHA